MNNVTELLIVEDNLKYQDALKTLIEFEPDCHCKKAFDSIEGLLKFLSSNKEQIDVLLLDIELPGKNGTESIPKIREHLPNVKIIMLTQLDNDISIFNSMSNGANGYMLKSSSLTEIIKSIRDVLSGISPMNPFIATRVLEMFQNISKPKIDYHLTSQEKNILNEVVEGLSKKMIADKLFISFHTVDSHIRNIYHKLNVNTQVGLVTKTLREQII